MSEPIRPTDVKPIPGETFWSQVKATPICDLLRGRVTASLDIRRACTSANLPEPFPDLIDHEVRRARIFSADRFRLAIEIANRVRTDLDAGRAPEELAISLKDSLGFTERLGPTFRGDSLARRAMHTPIVDLLRGRCSASLDPRRTIAVAGLPAVLSDLIHFVTRRTRLFRSEQVDVARELADHFHDGLAAGRTPEQLLKSFGDPLQAAELIRRAKLRSRPFVWRAWRRTWQSAGVLVILAVTMLIVSYVVLLVRMYLSRPTVERNYAMEVTAPSREVAESKRAWPLYREALLALKPQPNDEINTPEARQLDSEQPQRVLTWVRENQIALEKTREGAARPDFGFVYGDPADAAWYQSKQTDPAAMDLRPNRQLTFILLPQMQAVRELVWLLECDARRAAAVSDRTAYMSDVKAILQIAQQLHSDLPFLVVDAISFSFLREALSIIDDTLARQPDFLTDEDLQSLAHQIAAFGGGGQLRWRFDGERLSFRDLYQRIYTDNGRGDGHLTREGIQLLRDLAGNAQSDPLKTPDVVAGPALSAVMLSRREMTEFTEQLFDRIERECSQPYWNWPSTSVADEYSRWSQSPLDKLRYLPLFVIMPSLSNTAIAGERTTQQRDATLVALALELYRRKHGAWPASLVELVPDLLPSAPPDRFTGKPLSYCLVEDRPVVYSVGPDLDDDHGQSNDVDDKETMISATRSLNPDGDWIL